MKEPSKIKLIRSMVVMLAILVMPVLFICLYEKHYLQMVQLNYGQRMTKIKKELQQFGSSNQRKIEAKFQKMYELSNTRDYLIEEQTKIKLRNRVKYNSWICPLSNHKHIQIMSLLVLETRNQTVKIVKENIQKGLQWFNRQYKMHIKVILWNQSSFLDLSKLQNNALVVIINKFKYEFIEQNIANRLRKGQYHDVYYQKQILQELRSTSHFAHCRYTHHECRQTTFLLLNPSTKMTSYLNIEDSLFIFDQFDKSTLFNALAEYLQVWQFQKIRQNSEENTSLQLAQLYDLLKNQAYIQETIRALDYISFTHDPWVKDLQAELLKKWNKSPEAAYQYLLDGKHVSPYIHSPEQEKIVLELIQGIQQCWYNKKCEAVLEVNPMIDTRVGKIDIFPNNFKAGVYLPLLILFVYPIIIKLKDFLQYLFASNTKKKKSNIDSENELKQD